MIRSLLLFAFFRKRIVAEKPTMRQTKIKQMNENNVKKKPLGRRGMHRTAAGS